MRFLIMASALVALVGSPGVAYADTAPSERDRAFLTVAGNAAAFEVRGGQLATARGRDTRVHAAAIRLVADHLATLGQLGELDRQLGVAPEDSPGVDQRNILLLWSRLTVGPFDCAYAATEFLDHQVAVAAYQDEADHGDDPRIRAFAAVRLPVLHDHLAMLAAVLPDLDCQPPAGG